MFSFISLFFVALTCVDAHGFLYSQLPIQAPIQAGTVRNIKVIDYEIDALRNPMTYPNICRGAARTAPVPISLTNGVSASITLAISVGARTKSQHQNVL